MNKPVFVFGKKVIEYLVRVGGGVQMILLAFLFLPTLWRNRKEVYRQMMLCGIKSFGVTSVVALFTGMILALQAGLILKAYGQEMRVGFLVAQTMFREMGPFMTALILAASVGSGMAALLGTMKVSQELAALEVMSINPVRFLVAPRLLAMMVMCPVLTMYTDLIGILGGGWSPTRSSESAGPCISTMCVSCSMKGSSGWGYSRHGCSRSSSWRSVAIRGWLQRTERSAWDWRRKNRWSHVFWSS